MFGKNKESDKGVENGDIEKEENRGIIDEADNVDEYTGLVRYISSYRDTRRKSVATLSDQGDDAPKPKKWYAPWRKGAATTTFETPDEWLETPFNQGLSEQEVESRRKRTGFNELTTEKENMFLKFLSYFQGPILYGMFTQMHHTV